MLKRSEIRGHSGDQAFSDFDDVVGEWGYDDDDDDDCGVVPGWGHREGQGQAWNILSWRNTAKFYQILALSYNSQLWCKMFFLQ